MKMLTDEERGTLEMIQRTDYSEPRWPGHPAFNEARPTDVAVFDALHRHGRLIWAHGRRLPNGWTQQDPVVTEMGAKALRVHTLIRAWGVTT